MNEALPIGRLASSFFGASNDVLLQLKIGSQSYDATVVDLRKESSGIRYLEVTTATEGPDDFRRMEILNREGTVASFGKPTKKRDGSNEYVSPRRLVSREVLLQRERSRLESAILRKLGPTYPADTMLVIVVQAPMLQEAQTTDKIASSVVAQYRTELERFHSLAVLSIDDNYVWSQETSPRRDQ